MPSTDKSSSLIDDPGSGVVRSRSETSLHPSAAADISSAAGNDYEGDISRIMQDLNDLLQIFQSSLPAMQPPRSSSSSSGLMNQDKGNTAWAQEPRPIDKKYLLLGYDMKSLRHQAEVLDQVGSPLTLPSPSSTLTRRVWFCSIWESISS
jgi:hypothetical protein